MKQWVLLCVVKPFEWHANHAAASLVISGGKLIVGSNIAGQDTLKVFGNLDADWLCERTEHLGGRVSILCGCADWRLAVALHDVTMQDTTIRSAQLCALG